MASGVGGGYLMHIPGRANLARGLVFRYNSMTDFRNDICLKITWVVTGAPSLWPGVRACSQPSRDSTRVQ